MIPKNMESFLREALPERTWQNRLVRENGMCFMEFGPMDIDRLNRLGIHPDRLGPKLVACIWDEDSALEVGGYLVVDNLAMGRPSMGGVRMLPHLSPADVFNLARGMTLKNAAANLPYGGGKVGILANPASLTTEEHTEIVRRFAHLLQRYIDVYLPGPDVGTNDANMKTLAIENGLDTALSKPVEMGGNRIDVMGAAGGGLVIALQALLEALPQLKKLPQFAHVEVPEPDAITVMLQGFGSVGAHAARILKERMPFARVVGVSDAAGYLYDPTGLPVDTLFSLWRKHKLVTLPYYQEFIAGKAGENSTKYATNPDDLLREDAFCLIPAAPIARYLDTEKCSQPCMTVDRMGRWQVIIEGANTYSPDAENRSGRARMERAVYRERGVLIATDYLLNSGGVIFAAQEHLIKTPAHLRIPEEMLGKADEIEKWLVAHAADLQLLADKRLAAAEKSRDEVIRRNMCELIELLVSDADLLPCEAAEQISIRRMAIGERKRTAAEIMEHAITVTAGSSIRQAARVATDTGSPILIVTNDKGELAGVVTDWDITCAAAEGTSLAQPIDSIMTRLVVSAAPTDTILELVRKLEYHEISAMPVVKDGCVLGMVSTDLLARRSLYPLLISN